MKPGPDTRINPQEIPPPTRNGRALVDGEAGEDPIEVVAARYRLTRQQAEEIFQYFDESMNSGDTMLHGSLAAALRERDKQWFLSVAKMFSILLDRTEKQPEPHFKQMSIVTLAYVLNFRDEAGVASFADIARKCLKLVRKQTGKATAQKCGEHFIEQLKLAPMLTQRTESARQEMAKARLEWIQNNPESGNDTDEQK